MTAILDRPTAAHRGPKPTNPQSWRAPRAHMPRPVVHASRWAGLKQRAGNLAARGQIKAWGTLVPGLGLVDAALFQFGTFAGLLTTGISLLVLNWVVSD